MAKLNERWMLQIKGAIQFWMICKEATKMVVLASV